MSLEIFRALLHGESSTIFKDGCECDHYFSNIIEHDKILQFYPYQADLPDLLSKE